MKKFRKYEQSAQTKWNTTVGRQYLQSTALTRCAKCGLGYGLTVDHIKPKSRYPKLAQDVTNIQWLCVFKCHPRKTSVEKSEGFTNDKFLKGEYDL